MDISSKLQTDVHLGELETRSREIIAELDVGVTKANFAVAETGCLVEVSFTDHERLLSSISRVHIAVLEDTDVLQKLAGLAPIIRSLLSSKNSRKPAITFIAGPSRTSDIELKQVIGVHGPHEVHLVVNKHGVKRR